MKTKLARDLAKGLIVDIDGAMSGQERDIAERHTALASAVIVGARLLAGACVNLARLAQAAEDIADHMYEESEGKES